MPAMHPVKKRKRAYKMDNDLYFGYKVAPKKIGLEALTNGRRPTLLGVSRLMNDINNYVKTVDVQGTGPAADKKRSILKRVYGTKTAEDYLRSGTILVQGNNVSGPLKAAYGCHQQSMVLHKAMSSIGMKPELMRFMYKGRPHTTVVFESNGKNYEADPFYGRISLLDPAEYAKRKPAPVQPISWREYVRQLNEAEKSV